MQWAQQTVFIFLRLLDLIRGMVGLETMSLGKDGKVERSENDLEQMQSGKQPLEYYLTLRSEAANMQSSGKLTL